ncbi:putative integral membrane protein [Brugia pahangi]
MTEFCNVTSRHHAVVLFSDVISLVGDNGIARICLVYCKIPMISSCMYFCSVILHNGYDSLVFGLPVERCYHFCFLSGFICFAAEVIYTVCFAFLTIFWKI